MTIIQEQAIRLIQQLTDDKILPLITHLEVVTEQRKPDDALKVAKKKAALAALERLKLDLPDDFDADKELAEALEEKYGTFS